MSIDILMATYNGEKYLAEQIESIRAQTYEDWRLLVSDDCSSDDTLKILHEYEQKDPRIKVVSEGVRHGGAKENFWSLLPHADAPYVMFCDQDDVWHSDKIERTIAEMHRMEGVYGAETPLLVYTDLNIVDADLNVISESFMRHENYYPAKLEYENLVFRNVAPGCTLLFNRALLDAAFISKKPDYAEMHDWWFMLVASATGHIHYIDEPTIDYRQHDRNAIGVSKPTGFKLPNTGNALNKAVLTRMRTAVMLDHLSPVVRDECLARMIDYRNSGQGGIKGLYLLARSGFWDRDLRKRFGQIYATLFRLNRGLYREAILGRSQE